MPNPLGSDVHVSRQLTNVAIAYLQNANNYLSRSLFSEVPVEDKTGKYLTIPKGAWLRDGMKKRAPGAEAAKIDFDANFDSTYSCDRYDARKDIPDEYRDVQSVPFNFDKMTTQFLTQQALTKQEVLFIANYFKTGVWGTDKTPGTTWDDAASNIFDDMATARRTILLDTGMMPNKFGVSYDVHKAILDHPDIIDRVKYVAGKSFDIAVAPGNEVNAALAAIFQVEKYVVGSAVYNSANEGSAAASMAFAAGKNALLCYAPDSSSLFMPSAGYQFAWKKFAGNNDGVRVKKYTVDTIESDAFEVAFSKDFKVVSSDCGYYFNGAVA